MLPIFGLLAGGALLVGAGKLLLEIFEDEAYSARSEWRERSEELAQKTDEYNRAMERQLTTSAQSIEFKRLIGLYHDSRKTADLDYRCLQEGRTIQKRLNRVLHELEKDIEDRQETIKRRGFVKKKKAREELQVMLDLRGNLFEERTQTAEKNEELRRRVRELNRNTQQLKLQIRDNCGHGGRIWFDRLEQGRLTSTKHATLKKG